MGRRDLRLARGSKFSNAEIACAVRLRVKAYLLSKTEDVKIPVSKASFTSEMAFDSELDISSGSLG